MRISDWSSDVCSSDPNILCRCHAHIDDKRAALARKTRPILISNAFALSCDESHGTGGVAMSEWQLCFGGAADRGADARHHFHRHARRTALFGFFTAAPKNIRIAALQAHDIMPSLCLPDRKSTRLNSSH